jgi:hypothetical protein
MPENVPVAAPLRRRVLSSVVTIALALAGVVAFAPPAHAAGYGPGYDIGNGHLGAYNVGGVNVYCLEIEKARPLGATSGPSYQGWGALSSLDLARINMAVSTFGQSTDRRVTAAVDLYVWSVADAAEYNSHGMSGDSWFITRATGADIPTIRANLAAIRAAAAGTTVGTSGTGSATLSIQMFDSYDGQVTVTVSPASANGTLHLDGATVAGTPADTSPVTNGSIIPIRGTPLDSQTDEYSITASATFAVTNSGGFLGQIAVYTTGAAQRLAGPGGSAPASYTFSAADYVTDPLALQFEPMITTQVSDELVQPGEAMVDVLTAGLSATSPASEWRTNEAGVYHPILATGVLFGPTSSPPPIGGEPPSGATVAWSETAVLTGPGNFLSSGAFVATTSGYYTWVWSIEFHKQSPRVQQLITDDYFWQDDYGLVSETSVVSIRVGAATEVSASSVGLRGRVADVLSVAHDDATGLWWTTESGEPATAHFRGVAYWVPGDTQPSVTSDPPTNAIPIASREFEQIRAPGSYTTAPVVSPQIGNGFIVWQWELVPDAAGAFVPWRDAFGLPAETTRVTMPTLATSADAIVAATGEAVDTATVGGAPTGEPTYLSFAVYRQTDTDVPVCDASTLVDDSIDEPIEVPGPGTFASAPVILEDVGIYSWIATLRTGEGEIIESGRCGDPDETTEVVPFVVATEAVERIAPGEFARDVATIVGPTPAGATITFAAYRQGAETVGPECHDDNRVFSTRADPLRLDGPGVYESADGKLERAGTYLWVETIQSRSGAVLHVGECGARYEVTDVQAPTLALTGATATSVLALAAALSTASGLALILGARRGRAVSSRRRN